MSLKLKIRPGVGLLLGLGSYAFATVAYLKRRAHGIEQADFETTRRTVVAFMAAGTVLDVVLVVRLPRAMVRPLHRLRANMEQVAGPGQTTRVAVRKNDEIGTVAAVNLGLSIARELIAAQVGQLWVESQPPAGSCFAFTLPVAG